MALPQLLRNLMDMSDDEIQRAKPRIRTLNYEESSSKVEVKIATEDRMSEKVSTFADIIKNSRIMEWPPKRREVIQPARVTNIIEDVKLNEKFIQMIPGDVRAIEVRTKPFCRVCQKSVATIEMFLAESTGKFGRVLKCHGQAEFRLFSVTDDELYNIRSGLMTWLPYIESAAGIAAEFYPPKAEPPELPVDGLMKIKTGRKIK